MSEVKDDRLWQIALRRAEFRRSLYSYIIVNTFLWLIWWFTTGRYTGANGYPWPVWVMLGWGIGLGKQYFEAYQGSKSELTQQEYEKLKRRQEGL